MRDHRVDFYRGISLLFILWNHVFWAVGSQVPFLLRFTPYYWGFASSTEAFVFLSGYVYGIVYLRVAERFGPMALFAKSALRAWQLYVANAVSMLLSLGLVSWWTKYGPGPTNAVRTRLQLDAFMTPDSSLFWNLVQLYRIPWGFDVLALYIMLLLLAPIYIMLSKRKALLAVIASVALYGMAQAGMNLPSGGTGGTWYFNPFAWQLLFLTGILVGVRKLGMPRWRWAVVVSGMIVGAVAAWVWLLPWAAPHLPIGSGTVRRLVQMPVPWIGPTNLEPVRLFYFLALVLFVAALSKRSNPFWTSARARPAVLVGQFSLEVFCFGLVYTYAAALVVPALGGGWPMTALGGLLGCALSVSFAYLLRARRTTLTLLAGKTAVNPHGGGSARD